MHTDSRVRLEALVSGDVQGVGFRAWARERATALGLVGSARNLPDGRVAVVAEGTRPACEQLASALRGWDAPGRVENVSVSWTDPEGTGFGFRAV